MLYLVSNKRILENRKSSGGMKMFIAPTTKAVGSVLVTKCQPTALVVGVSKKEYRTDGFSRRSFEK